MTDVHVGRVCLDTDMWKHGKNYVNTQRYGYLQAQEKALYKPILMTH